jgi:peptidyl-prolyl cis-trans isomerase B (cyclophilin B)
MKSLFLFLISLCILMTSEAQEKKDFVVTIKTPFGDMIALLYDDTPKHKENFIKLAKEHFYDSLLFHRVIEGFMIQGGDPNSRNAAKGQPLGSGGPGYTIDAEILPKYFHEKGALSAARLGDQQNPARASSGSQFYIVQGSKVSEEQLKADPVKFNQAMRMFFADTVNKPYYDTLMGFVQKNDRSAYETYLMDLKPKVEAHVGFKTDRQVSPEKLNAYTTIGGAPHLDEQYTVFGKVIKGLEVIDKIAAQKTDQGNRPLEDIKMTVTVEELPKSKIEKLYGYQYPK